MIKKKHSAALKAKVALEAIRSEDAIAVIALRYQIHPNCVSNWKAELLAKIVSVFETSSSSAASSRSSQSSDDEIIALERKVGQLVVENDFLKKIG